MTYPHVPAAFINAIAEEGLFGDAIEFLQKQWNETCALRAELKELRGPLGPCTQQEIDAFEGLDPKSRRLFLLWVERAMKAEARAERLRLELEKIAWMDEFLNANGAQAMMQIARDAVNADECSVQAPPKGDAVAWRWRVKGDQNWNLSSRMPAELNDYCEIEPLYAASTTERKALDREEKLLLEEYHSGRLNGNRVIKAAFERLRAALSRSTGSGDGK